MKYWIKAIHNKKAYMKLKPNIVTALENMSEDEALILALEILKEKYARERADIVLDCPLCTVYKDCRKCPWSLLVRADGFDVPCMDYLAERGLVASGVTKAKIDDFWNRYKIWKKALSL
jgi:hypothetical protein